MVTECGVVVIFCETHDWYIFSIICICNIIHIICVICYSNGNGTVIYVRNDANGVTSYNIKERIYTTEIKVF